MRAHLRGLLRGRARPGRGRPGPRRGAQRPGPRPGGALGSGGPARPDPGPALPPPRPRSLRILALVASLSAAAAALALVLLGVASRGEPAPAFRAAEISPSRPAPATSGTGFDGRPVSVPTAGRPALVTFLFADCPDVCPTIAAVVASALDDLGPAAGELDVVAVSVDPEGDTRAAVGGFLDRFRLRGRMDYITGTRAELAPLWRDWLIVAQPEGRDASIHSARVVLVDRAGRQVASYAAGVTVPVADLTADLRALIGS